MGVVGTQIAGPVGGGGAHDHLPVRGDQGEEIEAELAANHVQAGAGLRAAPVLDAARIDHQALGRGHGHHRLHLVQPGRVHGPRARQVEAHPVLRVVHDPVLDHADPEPTREQPEKQDQRGKAEEEASS